MTRDVSYVYIVLKPVGSARLTFDDDLYYELCDLMYRRFFGVPDDITDMTRSLERFRVIGVFFGVPESYGNSPGSIWALLGFRERERGGCAPHKA